MVYPLRRDFCCSLLLDEMCLVLKNMLVSSDDRVIFSPVPNSGLDNPSFFSSDL